MAYIHLIEADRLEHAQEMDARYHLAMMIAQGFNGGAQVVWDERNAWRSGLLAASDPSLPTLSPDEHMALAIEIQGRLAKAGVLKGTH